MRLKDIGEFGLIREIARRRKTSPAVIKGIGDDCAVLRYTKDKYLLITADMIIEDVHFRLNRATPQQIGHKAMAVDISDIAACGGVGKWAVVSAGLPKDTDLDFIDRIYSSIERIASKFNIDIIGGDTNLSEKIVISITVIGQVRKENLILRNGAKVRDIIFLTGRLTQKPDDLNFIPRIKEASFLVNNFKINSMIDISDGLLLDLGHIISESKVGACLYESLIPYEGTSIKKAITTGEQFELLFTTDGKYAKSILSRAKRKNINLTAIGEITGRKGKIVFVNRKGGRKQLCAEGYRHF
ncbi:MAG: thiamine-monophosphate kinase [Candidatus Omnitrophota bacterium]|nr:MAG: thiamine-monophosphate kinase [Candidatus Omnitrophota bacterium]